MATVRPPSAPTYSTYPLEKLRTFWGRAKLTTDQMIGHLLQHLLGLENRLRRVEHLPAAPTGSTGGELHQ